MNELVKIENNDIVINQEWIEKYKRFKRIQLEMDLAEKEFKEELKNAMEQIGKPNLILDGFSASIRKESTRTTLDNKRLKEELPDIFEEYSITSKISSSITLKCD